MEEESKIEKLHKTIKNGALDLSNFNKTIKIIYLCIVPIFSLLVFLKEVVLDKALIDKMGYPWNFWYVIGIIILSTILIIFTYLFYRIQKNEDIFIKEALDHKEALENYDKLDEFIDEYTSSTNEEIEQIDIFIKFINDSFPAIFNKFFLENNKEENFYKNFCILMEILYDRLEYIYKKPEKQLITIALYLYDPEEPSEYKLKPYYSKKPNIMSKGKGRWWKRGDGQIGITFDKKQPFNYSNIHTQINPPTENTSPDDKINYKSTIAIPVFINPEEDNLYNKTVRGVFCITSNIESAFCLEEYFSHHEETSFKIRENIAKITASVIELLFNETYGRKLTSISKSFNYLPSEEKDKIEQCKPEILKTKQS